MNGLELTVDKGGGGAYFVETATKRQVMRYADLHVWDAKGRKLPARMARLSGQRLVIEVNDQRAVYPVVVDPLSFSTAIIGPQAGDQFAFSLAADVYSSDGTGLGTTPAQTYPTPNGQSGASFGFSVAGIPKFNGNGAFAVGAPGWPVNGNAEAGKVFVYDTPNNTTPAAEEAPVSQAGAEFGYSVAGGDVNGSSYGDLIVGAPYEDGNPLNGPMTDAGVVYVYYADGVGGLNGTPDTQQGDAAYAYLGLSVAWIPYIVTPNPNLTKGVLVGAPNDPGIGGTQHYGACYALYYTP